MTELRPVQIIDLPPVNIIKYEVSQGVCITVCSIRGEDTRVGSIKCLNCRGLIHRNSDIDEVVCGGIPCRE